MCFSLGFFFEVQPLLISLPSSPLLEPERFLLKTCNLVLSSVCTSETLTADFFSRDKDIRSFSSHFFLSGDFVSRGFLHSAVFKWSLSLLTLFSFNLEPGTEESVVRETLFFPAVLWDSNLVSTLSDSDRSLLVVVEVKSLLYFFNSSITSFTWT